MEFINGQSVECVEDFLSEFTEEDKNKLSEEFLNSMPQVGQTYTFQEYVEETKDNEGNPQHLILQEFPNGRFALLKTFLDDSIAPTPYFI